MKIQVDSPVATITVATAAAAIFTTIITITYSKTPKKMLSEQLDASTSLSTTGALNVRHAHLSD